jgi:hypothetical protein
MTDKLLPFVARDTSDHSAPTIAQRRFGRIKAKSLKHILLDRFLNHYGFDKGHVVATVIVEDILQIIEHFYRYTDNSFLKEGQIVWHAVPITEYPKRGKSMAQTKLLPVFLDMITESDLEDLRQQIHHRELRLKRIERITLQAFDQGALLSLLDIAVLFNVAEPTAGEYLREYQSLYGRTLPTRGSVQLIGGGQTHKQQIITLHLKGYLVPSICTKTSHSKEAVERYINDFEAIRLLSTKFDDVDTISRVRRLAPSVVRQYLDLIPPDS